MKKSLLCLVSLLVMGACTTKSDPAPNSKFINSVSGKEVYIQDVSVGSFSKDAKKFMVKDSTVELSFIDSGSTATSATYIGSHNGEEMRLEFTSITDTGGNIEQFVNGQSIGKDVFTFKPITTVN